MTLAELLLNYPLKSAAENCMGSSGVPMGNWDVALGHEKTQLVLGLIDGRLSPVEFIAGMQAYGYDHHVPILKCLIDAFSIGA